MKSSKVSYYFSLLMGVALIAGGLGMIHGFYFPEQSMISGDLTGFMETFMPAAMCFGFGIFLLLRFGVVEFGEKFIFLNRYRKTIEVSWSDVDKIKVVPFCSPPVYRLSFRNDIKPVYFTMKESYAQVDLFFWSWSWGSSKVVEYVNSRISEVDSN